MTPGVPARLAVSGLTVRFGERTALQDVTLEVAPRAVAGVIGPNGAGKSTLLDVVGGVTRPDGGSLAFDGARLRPSRRQLAALGIARVTQELALPADRTVADHVLAGLAPPPRTGIGVVLAGLSRTEQAGGDARERVLGLLRELGIAGTADELLPALPRAAQVRAAIARAVVAGPRLLLLDEPAAGLGPAERLELAALIRSFATRPGRDCSVLLVEHHADVIEASCSTVAVLDAGVVVARGTPTELRGDPAVAEAYL